MVDFITCLDAAAKKTSSDSLPSDYFAIIAPSLGNNKRGKFHNTLDRIRVLSRNFATVNKKNKRKIAILAKQNVSVSLR